MTLFLMDFIQRSLTMITKLIKYFIVLIAVFPLTLMAMDGPQYGDEPTGPDYTSDQSTTLTPVREEQNDIIVNYSYLTTSNNRAIYVNNSLDSSFSIDIIDNQDNCYYIDVYYQDTLIGSYDINDDTYPSFNPVEDLSITNFELSNLGFYTYNQPVFINNNLLLE